jgi:putative ABC transport system permease protein
MNLATLVRRNVLRNKTRFVMTVLALAFTTMTFLTLRAARRSWDHAVDLARRDRLYTRNEVTFVMGLPKRYVDDAREAKTAAGTPLLSTVSYASWFGGRVPGREQEFFASMAVDADTYFDVYDEAIVAPDEKKAFVEDKNGALVGDALAQRFGWKVGDRITLESPIYPAPDGMPWTFTLRGTYRTNVQGADRRSFFFHWSRFDEGRPLDQRGEVGWLTSRTAGGANAADAAKALDAVFAERDVRTLSQDERAFNTGFLGMVSTVLDVVSLLALVLLGIMALVLMNAVALSVRERSAEWATLKAIGVPPAKVLLVIALEAGVIALVGSGLGLLLGFAFVNHGIGKFFEENLASMFPVFRVDATVVAESLLGALVVGTLAGLVPGASAARAPVLEALRRVA